MTNYLPAAETSLIGLVDRVEAVLDAAGLDFGHGTDNARDEAAWLVLEALGRSPVEPVSDVEESIPAPAVVGVDQLLQRRVATRRPLAYLTGRAWFAGLEFRVDERSLVPRSPLAELIAERFVPWLRPGPVHRVLDIGTGGGCIAVACAHFLPEAHVDAIDTAAEALALARENVAAHALADRVDLIHGDVYTGLASRRYDIIVSNPPYVDAERMATLPLEYRHEPGAALAGGVNGVDVIERILAGAREHLAADGLLVVESGAAGAVIAERWPELPLVWPELETGEAGVFLIEARDLP